MEDLIKALTILLKYSNPYNPTHCEHDVMTISEINPEDVSEEDKETLKNLGFFVGQDYDEPMFKSYRFGSA
jgi:hypothetical protein